MLYVDLNVQYQKVVRRQLAAHEIAQMLDAVDIRQGGRDEDTAHWLPGIGCVTMTGNA